MIASNLHWDLKAKMACAYVVSLGLQVRVSFLLQVHKRAQELAIHAQALSPHVFVNNVVFSTYELRKF